MQEQQQILRFAQDDKSLVYLDRSSGFADTFFPEVGAFGLEFCYQVDAVLVVQVEDVEAFFFEPGEAALGVDGVAYDDLFEFELMNEAGAVEAGGECGDEDGVVPVGAATGVAEGVGFAVEGAVAFLDQAVVAFAEEGSVDVEDGSADRDAAFGVAYAGFFEGYGQHFFRGWHWGMVAVRDLGREGFVF
jgi:hypothetical protein